MKYFKLVSKQSWLANNIGLPLPSPPQKRLVSAYRASRARNQGGEPPEGRERLDGWMWIPPEKPRSVLVAMAPSCS